MIADVAKADQRERLIVVTNEAPSLEWLRQNRSPSQFGYELVVQKPANHAVVIDLLQVT